MTSPTTVSIAGSTGSIGTQTLDVVAAEPDRFRVVALGAGSSVEALITQAKAVTTSGVRLHSTVALATEVITTP